jgi:hypothetical protein
MGVQCPKLGEGTAIHAIARTVATYCGLPADSCVAQARREGRPLGGCLAMKGIDQGSLQADPRRIIGMKRTRHTNCRVPPWTGKDITSFQLVGMSGLVRKIHSFSGKVLH